MGEHARHGHTRVIRIDDDVYGRLQELGFDSIFPPGTTAFYEKWTPYLFDGVTGIGSGWKLERGGD